MRLLICALCVPLLSACANLNASLETVRGLWRPPGPVFAKGFEYLEVTVDGRRSVMALGSREQQRGAWVEQWFSGQGEMLELRDGRIHRVLGMTREVRHTQVSAPGWQALVGPSDGAHWTRQRQVMPGYQVRSEQVSTRPLAKAMPAQPEASWIEEAVATQLLDGRPWRYSERFALQQGRVVYSEQCIAPDLCFKLRPLGVPQP